MKLREDGMPFTPTAFASVEGSLQVYWLIFVVETQGGNSKKSMTISRIQRCWACDGGPGCRTMGQNLDTLVNMQKALNVDECRLP